MPDNTVLNLGAGGDTIATKDIAGIKHELVILEFDNGSGGATEVSAANPLPVTAIIDKTGLATDTLQNSEITQLINIVNKLSSDPATQTTLAAILTKLNASIAVTIATNTPDVTDRAARLLGHVTVDNTSIPVTGTFFQTTQPVSLATNTPDVTDRSGRLLGHVTVDNASIAVTGTFFQGTQPVSIAATVATSEVAPTTVFNGKTTVTAAGTRVVLAASTTVKSVTIKALSTNTGLIYVGNSTVSSANGFQLAAGDTISMDIANLNTVNIDSSVSGEGVTYIGVN